MFSYNKDDGLVTSRDVEMFSRQEGAAPVRTPSITEACTGCLARRASPHMEHKRLKDTCLLTEIEVVVPDLSRAVSPSFIAFTKCVDLRRFQR